MFACSAQAVLGSKCMHCQIHRNPAPARLAYNDLRPTCTVCLQSANEKKKKYIYIYIQSVIISGPLK